MKTSNQGHSGPGNQVINLPIAEWEAAFPGQQVHRGMPNHMRRAMHCARALVNAVERGDYILAGCCLAALCRATTAGRQK